MSRELETGQLVVDQFPAFNDDGYTKRSGLSVAGGDFTVSVFKDGVVDVTPVFITEIGSLGEYRVAFTPLVSGLYAVEVVIDFNKDTWVGFYQSTSAPTKLDEIHKRSGLDANNAMVVSASYIRIPADGSLIDVKLSEADDVVTVQRQ